MTLCNPTDGSPPGFFCLWDSSGRNTGVGCHFLLQGIFPTQGLNPGLPHWRQILYHLSRYLNCRRNSFTHSCWLIWNCNSALSPCPVSNPHHMINLCFIHISLLIFLLPCVSLLKCHLHFEHVLARKVCRRTSLVVQWLRIRLLMQGTWVQSLVGGLRARMPQGT